MFAKKQQRYQKAFQSWEQEKPYAYNEFMQAICLTQLGRYVEAQDLYRRATWGFISLRRLWHMPGCPHQPVEAYVLAGQPQPYARVYQEVNVYKEDRRGESLVALYAYALLELIVDNDNRAVEYVPGLLQYPEYREMVAIGQTIAAVVHRAQAEFDNALTVLLEAHRGMAQHGALRSTPEGFISLPGMCLAKMALDRGLVIQLASEYLPKDYLAYLQHNQAS